MGETGRIKALRAGSVHGRRHNAIKLARFFIYYFYLYCGRKNNSDSEINFYVQINL